MVVVSTFLSFLSTFLAIASTFQCQTGFSMILRRRLFLNLHFGDFPVSGTQCPGSEQELYGLEQ